MTTEARVLDRLLFRLRIRAESWLTIATLASSLGVPRREIEAAIEALRLAGEPVIGGSEGVRLALDPAEVREYALSRRHRVLSVSRGTRALLATARRMEGVEVGQRTLGLVL